MFEVRWSTEARQALARHWIQGDTTRRRAITIASSEIDCLLRDIPTEAGESRHGRFRVLHEAPLAVEFILDK